MSRSRPRQQRPRRQRAGRRQESTAQRQWWTSSRIIGLVVVLAIVAVIAPVALLAGGGGSDAPTVGDPAPEFMLASAEGEQRALGELLADREALVLVFYRGVF